MFLQTLDNHHFIMWLLSYNMSPNSIYMNSSVIHTIYPNPLNSLKIQIFYIKQLCRTAFFHLSCGNQHVVQL